MLTLPFRRTATKTEPASDPTTETDAESFPAMQFRTRGGATVDLFEQAWTVTVPSSAGGPDQAHEHRGFNWVCRGCDDEGRDGRYRGYDEYQPRESRREANRHAADCWSMPKPTAR